MKFQTNYCQGMVCIERAKCAKLKRSIPYNIQCILSWNTMSIWDCIPVARLHRSICHAIDSIWKVRSQIVESKNKRIEWKLRIEKCQSTETVRRSTVLFAEVPSNQWKKASIRNSFLKAWKGLSLKRKSPEYFNAIQRFHLGILMVPLT